MLRKGAIVAQGAPSKVMNADNLRKVFDIEATITKIPGTDFPVCISYELLRNGVC